MYLVEGSARQESILWKWMPFAEACNKIPIVLMLKNSFARSYSRFLLFFFFYNRFRFGYIKSVSRVIYVSSQATVHQIYAYAHIKCIELMREVASNCRLPKELHAAEYPHWCCAQGSQSRSWSMLRRFARSLLRRGWDAAGTRQSRLSRIIFP